MSPTSNPAPPPTFSNAAPQTISLTHHTGDIFAAPDSSVLIHACNTKGSWGAGIALAFKTAYPNAYTAYHTRCISKSVQTGTCLLIAPCETDTGPKHWIACLFTSKAYGRKKDAPEEILRNTGSAVKELLVQVMQAREGEEKVGGLRMCRINSGKFGVEWERTKVVLEGIRLEGSGGGINIEIWDRGDEFV